MLVDNFYGPWCNFSCLGSESVKPNKAREDALKMYEIDYTLFSWFLATFPWMLFNPKGTFVVKKIERKRSHWPKAAVFLLSPLQNLNTFTFIPPTFKSPQSLFVH